jgi:ribosomal protein L40E
MTTRLFRKYICLQCYTNNCGYKTGRGSLKRKKSHKDAKSTKGLIPS